MYKFSQKKPKHCKITMIHFFFGKKTAYHFEYILPQKQKDTRQLGARLHVFKALTLWADAFYK